MNLPNYFLADLPPEATLSPAMIREACQTLKRNRTNYLAHRSTQDLVQSLSKVASHWLEPNYPFRKLALEQSPAATGFSPPVLASGLDYFFKELTPEKLGALLEQDLSHSQRLDTFVASNAEQRTKRAALGTAPELTVHFTAGNLPVPALLSITLGILVRSAQLIKCATGTAFLPRLFAHSLYEAEPKLGACLEVAEWPGGSEAVEDVLFEEADCFTVTGSDKTLGKIRSRLPTRVRFLGYGERISFAFVSNEVLAGIEQRKVVENSANDVVAWDQLGCLSPHVIYVQTGGTVPPELFAGLLAQELARREETEPRGKLPVETAAAISSRRAIYEMRAAHSPDTRLWSSKDSTAWTVVFEADPRFQLSCLHRFIYVKSVEDLNQALQAAESVRSKVSTVGVAAPQRSMPDLATQLARWGATRVCTVGRMQNPSLAWRHDGRPTLGDLIIWTDWES
jgi:hypothetical protein